jgi:purine nucleosidase
VKNVILDTDIGTDVDDAVALVLCLKSKKINIRAITTSVYDSRKRAMIAKKITNMFDKEIPIAYGRDYDKKWCIGYEGNGLLEEKEDAELLQSPLELIASTAKKYKNISLVCIGPLGNIADAINSNIKVKHVYFMGGAKEQNEKFIPNMDSHNVELDIKAAEEVFSSGIPLTIITKEISKRTYLTKEDLENIKRTKQPWVNYIYQNAMDWMKISKYDVSYMYDPLTMAVAIDKSLIKTKKLGSVEISVDVDSKRFKEYLLNILEVGK